ncbi:hydroxyacid dehydrogenase [Candidatus Aerophobetes bacterium]|nr:hydroxyacid dehydrogenase [Candidatus Aerophobetes bacterium]
MKKILLPQPIHDAGMKLLKGKAETVVAPDTSNQTLQKLVKDAHAIILRTRPCVDEDLISHARNLIIISRTGAGVDNVDIEAATKRGILVCNLPGVNALSVAEHTVAFILTLAKELKFMDDSMRKENWEVRNRYEATDLEGKVLGLVGVGKIGSRVAKMCQNAFNMQVIGYDPFVAKNSKIKDGVKFYDKIDEVFTRADFVSIHVAGTPETHGLVRENLLSKMKKDAYFINTSRGEVVDEKALIKALKERKIKGAALDVFSKEPPSKDNPLLKMENVILSPHSASLTRECAVRLAEGACEAVLDIFSGRLPENVYNKKQLEQAGFIKENKLVVGS